RQRAMATLVYEQADRLSGIITEMMAFAKPQPPRPVRCEAGHLINAAMAKAKDRTLPADRSFEVAVAGDIPELAVDPDQVADALAEVIDNAIQATHPKSGRVAVTAGHDPWSGRAVVTVADNGCGMDAAALDRAFDPFFSSKPAGRRRGLGLSKALRWIEAAGGSVRLDSRPGDGTRVVVLLPTAVGSRQ
ncbi:MAG: integral rane sensor hybrid histidine kinase, partial [Phycisphaerales bacterium]|nr:integral rane sensor hybrid histidine kinase [Phycisphaerales bacterium]